jgi:hypothetical protein
MALGTAEALTPGAWIALALAVGAVILIGGPAVYIRWIRPNRFEPRLGRERALALFGLGFVGSLVFTGIGRVLLDLGTPVFIVYALLALSIISMILGIVLTISSWPGSRSG